jgi:serine/threonine protein phosphatase PrpC
VTTDPAVASAERKPRDEEIDVFGMTHQGLVRTNNQDHFLFGTLHKTLRVRTTSLSTPELLELPGERLGSLFMVADGVGGSEGGEAASRVTIETMAAYGTHAMQCYYRSDSADDPSFLAELQDAARTCHETVLARARERGLPKMATTLTLALAVWPRLYLLQVGDSRAYRCRQGELELLTHDQTIAQALVDAGALKPADAMRSPLRNVLSSAIGGTNEPVVTQHELRHGDVVLLCSDGLTKHVSDDQIQERFRTMTSSEQACRALIDDTLKAGATDNVTVLVSRSVLQP